MEHEVYVPFPVGTVRQALTEPERVARCVPGVQLDAEAAPHRPEGRLRLRIGSSTITYRGALTVSDAAAGRPGEDGAAVVTVEAKGTESRGDGTVALTLTVRLSPTTEPGPGTTLACAGTVHSDGRLAEATDQAAESAGRRLLDRFAENLTADLQRRPVAEQTGDGGAAADAEGPAGRGVFETEVPPPSLEPRGDEDAVEAADLGEETGAAEDLGDVEDVADAEDVDAGDVTDAVHAAHDAHLDYAYGEDTDGDAPAEAAHARRTMIGRSAEEVDHAPPRGRYAPVPAPEPNATSMTLRWAAPAAAVVLASAVVVGRVLRRRR
ncbi:SRPBCC domain-containing protein [Streptomyces inhibens]|uniref:SRPBCC domain-containing protein n=1 Tax=Streptomyces inhibens TaxID=2293571 RepID=UPI001EE6C379|nr:SRPBCC domain-containing protein [Streptomyces inhibens]UKY51201.1 carbon monoxide dehydrogenase subunit G [Streptomyces inhibens]